MEETYTKYQKPSLLQQFASYSYYHILVVCDSTQTAAELSLSTEIQRFKRFSFENFFEGNGKPLSSKYEARYTPLGGRYITLIDGSVDADFIIESAEWATIYIPTTRSIDGETAATTQEVDGKMKITEPMGARFMEVMSKSVLDTFLTDPNGVVFLLKTIFVGHHDDGRTETIPTVRPLFFVSYDITASFSTAGAEYELSFVGVDNGVGKLSSLASLGQQVNLSIGPNDTLKDAMQNLQTNLQTHYDSYKTMIEGEYQKINKEYSLDANYRFVEYIIDLDSAYGEDSYKAGDEEHIRTQNKTDGSTVITAPASGGGIEELIQKVMVSSQKVIDDRKQPEPGVHLDVPPAKAFKITSRLESTPEKFIIVYKIIQYEMPVSPRVAGVDAGSVDPDPSQVIQLDYIFTGQNTNIIDFDMKMNMGLAFFQTLITSNNLPDQKSDANNQTLNPVPVTGAADGQTISSNNVPRSNTPLFFGLQVDNQMARNTKRPAEIADFREQINRWAVFENIDAKVKIHGSLELLDQILASAQSQANTRAGLGIRLSETNKLANREAYTALLNQDQVFIAAQIPNYVKLNISMPDTNQLHSTYSPFWYPGFFVLFAVDNSFDNGVFTQTLDMFSVPQKDKDKEITEEKSEVPTPNTETPAKKKGINQSTLDAMANASAEADAKFAATGEATTATRDEKPQEELTVDEIGQRTRARKEAIKNGSKII